MSKQLELNYMDKFYEALSRKYQNKKSVFNIKRRLADRLWSNIIRLRDGYICVRCHHQHGLKSKGIHNSHYFSRSREATRFMWDNCDTLCLACHLLWSKEKRAEYTAFKKKQLGFMRYEWLSFSAKIPNSEFENIDVERIKEFRRVLANEKIAAARVDKIPVMV